MLKTFTYYKDVECRSYFNAKTIRKQRKPGNNQVGKVATVNRRTLVIKILDPIENKRKCVGNAKEKRKTKRSKI